MQPSWEQIEHGPTWLLNPDDARPTDPCAALPIPGNTLFPTVIQGLDSDERFTPRWLFDALAEVFDVDVAAPVDGGDCVPAAIRFTRDDDLPLLEAVVDVVVPLVEAAIRAQYEQVGWMFYDGTGFHESKSEALCEATDCVPVFRERPA